MKSLPGPVTVGIAGSGYACCLHCKGYERVGKIPVRLKTVCDLNEAKATETANKFSIEQTCKDYREMLEDEEIDVIDICTPPFSHVPIIKDALQAGKHVICEKPLTGYFGMPADPQPIGKKVTKALMYERVLEEIEELKAVVEESDRLFMYAENYVYAPTLQKAAKIIQEKKSKLLFMKGEESLSGSSSPVAGRWDKTGGGSLIRVGIHPLAGILWLKSVEAKARNEDIAVKKVSCDVGTATDVLSDAERGYIKARPYDVEDVATLTVTFSDGTKALIIASDTVLGGTVNYVELYAHDASLLCRITPPGSMDTYFLDEKGLENVEIAEMLPTYIGWQHVFVSDEVLRGYVGEMQDFIECVVYGRRPLSGFDLACETIKVIYAAYRSAEEGKTIEIA